MKLLQVSLSLGLLFSLTSCLKEPIVIDSLAGEMPYLNEGNNIGMIIGFNPSHPPATEDSIEIRWNEAVDQGMKVGRLQIDWTELEETPNNFAPSELEERLADLADDELQIILSLGAYDSGGPVIPEDLKDLNFDDQELIDRYKNLMDWVIPMLASYGGFTISISNEADNSFEELPNLTNELKEFTRQVRAHIQGIDPNMAVSMTFAEGNIANYRKEIRMIIEELDVVTFNFYGNDILSLDTPDSPEIIRSGIRDMLDISGEKNIVIQELGMSSSPNFLNSSEEIQRDFFALFFEEMAAEPRIKAATIFQLVDWSQEVIDYILNELDEPELPQDFIDSYAEALRSIGLINYEDGVKKLAWEEYIKWIKEFK